MLLCRIGSLSVMSKVPLNLVRWPWDWKVPIPAEHRIWGNQLSAGISLVVNKDSSETLLLFSAVF